MGFVCLLYTRAFLVFKWTISYFGFKIDRFAFSSVNIEIGWLWGGKAYNTLIFKKKYKKFIRNPWGLPSWNDVIP